MDALDVLHRTLHSSTQRRFFCWSFSPFTQLEELTALPTFSGTAVLTACWWVQFLILMKLHQIQAWHSPAAQRTRGKGGTPCSCLTAHRGERDADTLMFLSLSSILPTCVSSLSAVAESPACQSIRAHVGWCVFTCSDIWICCTCPTIFTSLLSQLTSVTMVT